MHSAGHKIGSSIALFLRRRSVHGLTLNGHLPKLDGHRGFELLFILIDQNTNLTRKIITETTLVT